MTFTSNLSHYFQYLCHFEINFSPPLRTRAAPTFRGIETTSFKGIWLLDWKMLQPHPFKRLWGVILFSRSASEKEAKDHVFKMKRSFLSLWNDKRFDAPLCQPCTPVNILVVPNCFLKMSRTSRAQKLTSATLTRNDAERFWEEAIAFLHHRKVAIGSWREEMIAWDTAQSRAYWIVQ